MSILVVIFHYSVDQTSLVRLTLDSERLSVFALLIIIHWVPKEIALLEMEDSGGTTP